MCTVRPQQAWLGQWVSMPGRSAWPCQVDSALCWLGGPAGWSGLPVWLVWFGKLRWLAGFVGQAGRLGLLGRPSSYLRILRARGRQALFECSRG